ncbi:nucleotide-sugar transporter-domain-containing protein [Chytriomyces sp. MP71]|nr:nucleotide-sugar transporter-domain-containing protein [Chytriomyces sp. MP71]
MQQRTYEEGFVNLQFEGPLHTPNQEVDYAARLIQKHWKLRTHRAREKGQQQSLANLSNFFQFLVEGVNKWRKQHCKAHDPVLLPLIQNTNEYLKPSTKVETHWMKYISLTALVLQTTSNAIVVKFARESEASGPYLSSTVILLGEFVKFIVCTYMHLQDNPASQSFFTYYQELLGSQSDAWKMMVPAAIYVIQNNLQFLAMSKLDPAIYLVSNQVKILTTAMFSVWMLKRSLSKLKWIALVVLTIGIALVQVPSGQSVSNADNVTAKQSRQANFIGLGAVTIACFLSGLAGVWFEKVLKGSQASVWVRNAQLSLFSLIPALFGVYVVDGASIMDKGFLQGYNQWTVIVIALQSIGGLLVALVIKHADNILKGFASSIATILSVFISMVLFNFQPSMLFAAGTCLVLSAIQLYSRPDT